MQISINKDTVLCMSLSGRPGNFGTKFQNFLYRELGLNFIYKAFTTQDIRSAVGGIRALGIRGCAISMPFKESCIEFLDELDPSAQGIMAVNTIVNSDGRLKGFNTDFTAVLNLLNEGNVAKNVSNFAVLGSGGMAKAVVCALREAGFKNGTIVARNQKAGMALADQYGFSWKPELGDETPGLIVNVTPIGMAGGNTSNDLAFPIHVIEAAEFVFDVVAIPSETPLILCAKKMNKPVISGAEVIVLQALEQFELYTGIRPNQEMVDRAAAFARS